MGMLHHSSGDRACTNLLPDSDFDEKKSCTMIPKLYLDFRMCLLNIGSVHRGAPTEEHSMKGIC